MAGLICDSSSRPFPSFFTRRYSYSMILSIDGVASIYFILSTFLEALDHAIS